MQCERCNYFRWQIYAVLDGFVPCSSLVRMIMFFLLLDWFVQKDDMGRLIQPLGCLRFSRRRTNEPASQPLNALSTRSSSLVQLQLLFFQSGSEVFNLAFSQNSPVHACGLFFMLYALCINWIGQRTAIFCFLGFCVLSSNNIHGESLAIFAEKIEEELKSLCFF